MDSSSPSISIRGSEADFTMVSYEQHILHFGGFKTSTVEAWKVDDNYHGKQIPNVNI